MALGSSTVSSSLDIHPPLPSSTFSELEWNIIFDHLENSNHDQQCPKEFFGHLTVNNLCVCAMNTGIRLYGGKSSDAFTNSNPTSTRTTAPQLKLLILVRGVHYHNIIFEESDKTDCPIKRSPQSLQWPNTIRKSRTLSTRALGSCSNRRIDVNMSATSYPTTTRGEGSLDSSLSDCITPFPRNRSRP